MLPPAINPIPIPTSQLVRYVERGRTPLVIGCQIHEKRVESREHGSECHALREGYTYVEIRGKYRIPMHQLLERRRRKNVAAAKYIPREITSVIRPLSTCRPENRRETASPRP